MNSWLIGRPADTHRSPELIVLGLGVSEQRHRRDPFTVRNDRHAEDFPIEDLIFDANYPALVRADLNWHRARAGLPALSPQISDGHMAMVHGDPALGPREKARRLLALSAVSEAEPEYAVIAEQLELLIASLKG